MRIGLMVAVGFAGFAVASASAGYVVDSRFSEFKRVHFDNQMAPPPNEVFSTSGMGELLVPGSPVRHRSALTSTGATYNAYCDSSNVTGPPSGSGLSGYRDTSRFEIVFTITGTANFTLTASLQRWFMADSTLRLDPLTIGASPALLATAMGTVQDNFVPTPVNWSGTLLAGQYRLSILDHGIGDSATSTSFAKTSFTFTIPTPATTGALLALAIPAARRRRVAVK
jgi:hypothetical protein